MSESQAKRHTKTILNASPKSEYPEHSANMPVAEMEIGPHQTSLMSLGSFATDKPPVGFSIEFKTGDAANFATAEITSHPIRGELHYLLHVFNDSHFTLSAEVKQL